MEQLWRMNMNSFTLLMLKIYLLLFPLKLSCLDEWLLSMKILVGNLYYLLSCIKGFMIVNFTRRDVIDEADSLKVFLRYVC